MNNRALTFVHVCVLAAVTAFACYPSLQNGFVSLDDPVMLVENEKVFELSVDNLKRYFTEIHWGLYHPLVLVSYALEFRLFKLNPVVYHTTNLYLHLLNTFLVYWLFLLLMKKQWAAFVIALLFGVHPLHVESVAWVTERKDTLYACFYLGAAVSYLYFLESGRRCRYYALAIIFFILSLFSKAMAVSLPLLLILFDHFVLEKPRKMNYADKVPFFALSLVFSVFALFGQHSDMQKTVSWLTVFSENLLEANYNVLLYIYKTFIPAKLSIMYPYFIKGGGLMENYLWYSPLPSMLMAAITIYSLKYTKKVLFGVLFFLITILPASNLIPAGIGLPGDRYTYIPLIGIFYIIAEGLSALMGKIGRRRALNWLVILSVSVLCAMLVFLTRQRCGVWKNTFVLMSDVVKNYGGNINAKYAYYSIAGYYMGLGDMEKARSLNEKVFELDKGFYGYYEVESRIAYAGKEYGKALGLIDKAIVLRKGRGLPWMYVHKVGILIRLKDYNAAVKCTDEFLSRSGQNSKDYSSIYAARAWIYYAKKDYQESIEEATHALKMNPYNSDALLYRSLSYRKTGMPEKAVQDFKKMAEIEAIKASVEVISGSSGSVAYPTGGVAGAAS